MFTRNYKEIFLKECPFCGEKPKREIEDRWSAEMGPETEIVSCACGARLAVTEYSGHEQYVAKQNGTVLPYRSTAVERWNTRVNKLD